MSLFAGSRIMKSLYTRIVLVMLVGAFIVMIILVVGGSGAIGRSPASHSIMRNAINLFVELLIGEMGSPPDPEKARNYAQHLGVDLAIEQNGSSIFTTTPELPTSHQLDTAGATKGGRKFVGIALGRFDNRFFVWGDAGQTRLVFWGARGVHLIIKPEYAMIIISFILMVLLGCALAIRRLLKPLRDLSSGVTVLSVSDFKRPIDPLPVYGSIELAKLAASFNDMAQKIHQLIITKEQLLYDISHELRTPITRARLSLEEVTEEEVKKELREDLKELEELTNYLLESARLNSPFAVVASEMFSVLEIVQELVESYKSCGPGVVFSSVDLNRDNALGSATYARIVIKNLIDNACKYSGKNSKPVNVSLACTKMHMIVTVTDFGMGIPADDLPLVFEPFFRVDRSRSKKAGGFGLGLSLSRKLMLAQNGDLRLDSVHNEGTTATATFRLSRQELTGGISS